MINNLLKLNSFETVQFFDSFASKEQKKLETYALSAKPTNAIAGFRGAGLCPLNFGAINSAAFAPAAAMLSTSDHVNLQTGICFQLVFETDFSGESWQLVLG